VGDGRVRLEHKLFDKFTALKTDPIWRRLYTPLSWNCRCTIIPGIAKNLSKEYDSNWANKVVDPLVKGTIFDNNVGISKVIFTDKHPYFIANPIVLTIVNKPESDFKTVKSLKNGGTIEVHRLVDKKASDYSNIEQCCNHFAKTGSKTEILPIVHNKSEDYKTIYKDLIGTKYEGKCPDFRVDGKYYELEGFDITKNSNPVNTMGKMLSRGVKQSNKLIIKDCGVTRSFLVRNIKNRIFIDKQDFQEVWVLDTKGKLENVYNAKTP
jgi:hypothetical protein